MSINDKADTLRQNLEALPEVLMLGEIELADHLIKYISLEIRSTGKVAVYQLDIANARGLYEFYTEGLSEKPRRLFAPYPLFHRPPRSFDELAERVSKWKREDDWTALLMIKDERVIGFGLLKRFSTEQVTSGIAVRDEFLNKKLGYILQRMIVEQARLLGLERFHVKVVSDNLASILLHKKCGFRQTELLPANLYSDMFKFLRDCDRKNGKKEVQRQLVKMVIDLNETQP